MPRLSLQFPMRCFVCAAQIATFTAVFLSWEEAERLARWLAYDDGSYVLEPLLQVDRNQYCGVRLKDVRAVSTPECADSYDYYGGHDSESSASEPSTARSPHYSSDYYYDEGPDSPTYPSGNSPYGSGDSPRYTTSPPYGPTAAPYATVGGNIAGEAASRPPSYPHSTAASLLACQRTPSNRCRLCHQATRWRCSASHRRGRRRTATCGGSCPA